MTSAAVTALEFDALEVLESVSDGVLACDHDFRLLYVNGAAERQLGGRRDDLLGRRLCDVCPELAAWGSADEGVLRDAGRTGQRIEREYCSVRTRRWFSGSMCPRPGGWVLYFRDITQRREAEQALGDAGRRQDEFLAILAHELRNPLAPLRTGIEILRRGGIDRERLERLCAMMGRQVDHLVALIDDLMDVSRIRSGRIALERCPVELATVVHAALEATDPVIRHKHLEPGLVLPGEGVWVDGDRHRLAQALGNLLANAAKYTPSGGRVSVTLARDEREAIVRVGDTGVGIPPKMLGRVFDLFAQVDDPADRRPGGLGIGLTIVRQVVELHGGSVEAHSEGPGRGSEFVVRLPLSTHPSSDVDGGRRPDLDDGVPPRRVLVVDDNLDAAQAMATMLGLLGHRVEVAYDGEQALQVGERMRPEVILMDLGMPKMSGHEAARHIRQAGWGRDVLLVAVTGWGQQADRNASGQAGFDHHLVKPVELDQVQALVARLDSR